METEMEFDDHTERVLGGDMEAPIKESTLDQTSRPSRRKITTEDVGLDDRGGAENLVRAEARAVNIVRAVMIILLIGAATLTGIFTYRLSVKKHTESFIRDYDDVATGTTERFKDRLRNYLYQISTLSVVMSTGVFAGSQPFFPNVTLEAFNDLTSSLRLGAGALDIVWSPLLRNKKERSQFEAFATVSISDSTYTNTSNQNQPCFICGIGYEIADPSALVTTPDGSQYPCSAVAQAALSGFASAKECALASPFFVSHCGCKPSTSTDNLFTNDTTNNYNDYWNISDGIFRVDNNGTAMYDDSLGPFSPVWQKSPLLDGQNIIMFNQMTEPHRGRAIYAMLRTQQPVLSSSIRDNKDLFYNLSKYDPLSQRAFHALIFYPVFVSASSKKIVGSISLDFSWELLLTFGLTERSDGMVIVLENSCGQVFTFKVVSKHAVFLGEGDLHDPNFDSMEHSTNYSDLQGIFQSTAPTQTRYKASQTGVGCVYRLRVYPSNDFQTRYESNEPWQITTVVVFIFLFTSLLFLFYDFIVRRIQAKVLSSAKRSETIVSSLFPAVVRDRLFYQSSSQNTQNKSQQVTASVKAAQTPQRRQSLATGLTNHKARLRSYLSHPPGVDMIQDQEPIADLFPNTTIMFADIAGFTAWSSEREPSQVFKLLETLYGAFDQVAKKLGVYKVETIGDSYVAVAGLPEPMEEHCVVMVKFAYECLILTHELTRKLECSLGPGTADLDVRIGLHSGPVIAGVLRGERARFQLFGDTVNVASRMESTGVVSQIQVSKETAQLLIQAGKCDWVDERSDLVEVKGKGKLQTYFVNPSKSSLPPAIKDQHHDQSPEEYPMNVPNSDDDPNTPYASIRGSTTLETLALRKSPLERQNRMVEWNVDILYQLLQKIVAKNIASSKQRKRLKSSRLMHDATLPVHLSEHVVDEIREVINIPHFDEKTVKEGVDFSHIDLGPTVRIQLVEYVRRIALLYRDNAFHNFEHASHVTMSANKLLNRIIIPDDVEYDTLEPGKKRKCQKTLSKNIHYSTFGISSDPLMQFAVVFSALIHDVDHTGLPNKQLVKSGDPLAIRYRNKCVAEQHSVRTAWQVLMEEQYVDLRGCIYRTEEEGLRFRQLVINAVIATDIADKELQSWRKLRWDKAFDGKFDGTDQSQHKLLIDRKANIVYEYIIQASDVAHTMQHWHVYLKWNTRLFKERYTAFVEGKDEEDPALNWFQDELMFFDKYVIPLAKTLQECNVFGVSCDEYLCYAQENRNEWLAKGEQAVAEMVIECKKGQYCKRSLEPEEEDDHQLSMC